MIELTKIEKNFKMDYNKNDHNITILFIEKLNISLITDIIFALTIIYFGKLRTLRLNNFVFRVDSTKRKLFLKKINFVFVVRWAVFIF